jgi:hypothetical protein
MHADCESQRSQTARPHLMLPFRPGAGGGPDTQQALNLGIFYKDTLGKKRWVLKFDDSKMLDQIDAVFVTLEPGGESHKPSGKSLLFAYLKANSNHP